MLILVTGANGFIAGRLIPRLLQRGHRVRALTRDPSRLGCKAWARGTDIVRGDVMRPSTLSAALDGVDTAYYLIHSMSTGNGYGARDVEGARNFALAAASAGVSHIIYLGGLADPEQRIGPHMRSRVETGAALRQGPVPVTEFRASVIAGAGSTSFEMIRRITDLFPVIPGPTWMRHKSQPIAADNVVDYLVGALERADAQGHVFEIGGPDVMSYDELMLEYARVRGLSRHVLLIPGLPIWLLALGFQLLTPVPRCTAAALVGELRVDSVVTHGETLRFLPEVKLISFASAARSAIAERKRSRADEVREAGWRLVDQLSPSLRIILSGALRRMQGAGAQLLSAPSPQFG